MQSAQILRMKIHSLYQVYYFDTFCLGILHVNTVCQNSVGSEAEWLDKSQASLRQVVPFFMTEGDEASQTVMPCIVGGFDI